MSTRVARRVLILLLATSLIPLALAQATHSPTVEQVMAAAVELGMRCTSGATQVDCDGPDQYYFREPHSVIRPATGPLQDVASQVNAHSNGIHDFLVEDRGWIRTLHAAGCADDEVEVTAIAAFLDSVATQLEESDGGTAGPALVGECSMTGTLFQAAPTAPWRWQITSQVTAGAFPTPTPAPTPPPAPSPRVAPTPTPTPAPSLTPTPTPTPSPSPTESATDSVEPSPEGTVGGIVFSPPPSVPSPDNAPDAGGGWVTSVPGPADVSTEPAALVSSALLAFLLLLFMGFVGELFNSTAKANYDVLVGWWSGSWLGRHIRRFIDFWKV